MARSDLRPGYAPRTRRTARIPAGTGRLAAAGCLLTGLLVLGGDVVSPAPPPAAAGWWRPHRVRLLLLDSWVTDGRHGWFVDGAHSATAAPFSLYETSWRARLAAVGDRPTRLNPDAVRQWTGRALDGRSGTAELPALAQVDAAVRLHDAVGARQDPRRVSRTLERLRSGGGYRASDSAAADWGSTATAVGLQRLLGLPVPRQVSDETARALSVLDPAVVTAENLTQIVALLETAGLLAARMPPAAARNLADTVRAADGVLTGAAGQADAVWLVTKAALDRAAGGLGFSAAPVDPAVCARLVDARGEVRLPGGEAADPQAAYAAAELGCPRVRTAPEGAYGRAGWPDRQEPADTVRVSTAAMRTARAEGIGLGDRFAAPLRRWIRDTGVPAVRRGTDLEEPMLGATRAGLRMLAAAVGGAAPREVDAALPEQRGPAAAPDDLRLLLTLVELSQDPAPSRRLLDRTRQVVDARRAARSPAAPAALRAAWLELAARQWQDDSLHRAAVDEIGALRIAPGVYSASRPADGNRTPSLTASAIGGWVERTSAAGDGAEDRAEDRLRAGWTDAGLCGPRYCAESAAALRSLDHMPLEALWLLLAAADGDHPYPVAA
ncbi:hypothetical protein [Streptomyces sp. NPDC050704]|uniref:hypothetical protein n=1 Tax=Streptomyces sp. NPDC050704 TaxID=3157219 RepID=UPI00341EF8EC